ncbi:c-type cytochrome [Methylococcus capsulatus]|uniref:Cytochrome c n=2 Tax=Methylococcus TaxID=413 RepID=A0ABZ2F3F5_METCP|nr:cytochrome c [Methylococcus capsulatus]MDF9392862.1 cytochrome c [Methylococcus capsulatus]
MKYHILWKVAVAGLAGMVGSGAVSAEGDRMSGKEKFYTCAGCHGIEGYSNTYPTYQVPKLAGQHEDYVVSSLKAYASGARQHGSMEGNAVSLSDKDLRDIAAYVAGFRAINVKNAVTGNVANGKKKAETSGCGGCHGEDGNGESPNPRLAGQYESYLMKALEDYKSGNRKNAIMNGLAGALSKEDIHDLAAYYSSQARGLSVVQDD